VIRGLSPTRPPVSLSQNHTRARSEMDVLHSMPTPTLRLKCGSAGDPRHARRNTLLGANVAELKSLYASRRPGTHLAAFSSVDIRPGIPPSSALRCTHLNDANRKGT
jgi:hypothetical protein